MTALSGRPCANFIFADESAQRQILVEMLERINLQGQDPAESLAQAAAAEQDLLDAYYGE